MTIDVFLRDNHVAPGRPMVRVRYRYRVRPHVVRAAIVVTELCRDGRCGWQGRAYVKEPKLQASVTGGGYSRLVVLDAHGRVARNTLEHGGSAVRLGGSRREATDGAVRRSRARDGAVRGDAAPPRSTCG